MKFKNSFLAILVFCLHTATQASVELVKTKHFSQVISETLATKNRFADNDPSKILVVFDIDDTILRVTACAEASNHWMSQAARCPMELTDPAVPGFIRNLQAENFGTLVLTARNLNLIKATERAFKVHGFDFLGKPFGADFNYRGPIVEDGKNIEIKDGKVFANGQNKADVLAYVNGLMEEPYKTIVFIDDSRKNIEDLKEKFTDDTSVHLMLFHYVEHSGE